jgi:FkbM family methyltransferase
MFDYLAYRKHVRNAWAMAQSRRSHQAGQTLEAVLHDGRTLALRGGTQDPSVFHEVFVRDVYRMASETAQLQDVLDLGGNVGMFSVRVAARSRRVFAYEPVPTNYEQLKINAAGYPNILAVNEAVGATRGVLKLFPGQSERGTGRFSAHPDASTHDTAHPFEVPCVTLETVFERHAIERLDLMKIDVEGAEHEILAAGVSLLGRVARIVGEYHPAPTGSAKSLKALLEAAGFAVETLPNPKTPGTGMFFARR